MKTLLLSSVVAIILSGCLHQSVVLEKENIELHASLDNTWKKILVLDSNNSKITYTMPSCARHSYIAQYNSKELEDLYIEHISLDSGCEWNGLASGFFEAQIKDKENFDSMRKIETVVYKNYEFAQYLVDENRSFNIVTIWDGRSFTFVIDPKMQATQKLLQKLQLKDNFQKNYKPYAMKEKPSLAKENWFQAYFSRKDSPDSFIIFQLF